MGQRRQARHPQERNRGAKRREPERADLQILPAKTGAENDLKISLTKDGFTFEIKPEKNDAIVYVDIPYATVKLEKATADAAGNLVFSGNIGFQTIFDGAEFSLEKLGYG